MPKQKNNFGMQGTSGTFNKQVVYKQYSEKTVLSKYPDMSNVKPSDKQTSHRRGFKIASAYAKYISRNPEMRAAVLPAVKPGQTVYTEVMSEFMAEFKRTGKSPRIEDLTKRLAAKQAQPAHLCNVLHCVNGIMPRVRKRF